MKTTSCILVAYFLSFTLISYAKSKDKEIEKNRVEQVGKEPTYSTNDISMLQDLFSASGDFNKDKSSKTKNKDKSNTAAIGDPFALSSDVFHEDDPWPKYK